MMNCLIVKVKTGSRTTTTYRKLLSDVVIYSMPADLTNALEYSPNTLHEDNEWYKISNFSGKSFCLQFLEDNFSSVNYDDLGTNEIDRIDFLCSYQDDIYYFQNVSRASLKPKKAIHLGDNYYFDENSKSISINHCADAIYVKPENILYFQKLSKITSIFKGIDILYREATDEETRNFLNERFIKLSNDFSADKVKTRNRQRIALAIDTINGLRGKDRKALFDYIAEYRPELKKGKRNVFAIGSEEDLKNFLYGIEQRYYTTEVNPERRIANSIIRFEIE